MEKQRKPPYLQPQAALSQVRTHVFLFRSLRPVALLFFSFPWLAPATRRTVVLQCASKRPREAPPPHSPLPFSSPYTHVWVESQSRWCHFHCMPICLVLPCLTSSTLARLQGSLPYRNSSFPLLSPPIRLLFNLPLIPPFLSHSGFPTPLPVLPTVSCDTIPTPVVRIHLVLSLYFSHGSTPQTISDIRSCATQTTDGERDNKNQLVNSLSATDTESLNRDFFSFFYQENRSRLWFLDAQKQKAN
ncbi:hypothetical protein LZ32DRAFT_147664 [Colletotrichum eremochloae]|nr:hypothetical protein LZ32DRAFT_147664 [Colletotrichum eremochloae]